MMRSRQVQRRAFTLVEVLVSLTLLSMLIASASVLTTYLVRVSADRQLLARDAMALDAAAALLAADLDAWNIDAAFDTDEIRSQPETRAVSGDSIVLVFADGGAEPRTIEYRWDRSASLLTRSDSAAAVPSSRLLIGNIKEFIVETVIGERVGSNTSSQQLRIQIHLTSGMSRTVLSYLAEVDRDDP